MALINVVTEGGIVQEEVFSAEFAIKIDGEILTPAYVEEVEVENNGETVTLTDDCGRQEQRRFNEGLWSVRVTGVVAKEGAIDELLLRDLMTLQEGELVEIISDFEIDGPIEVSNTIIGQTTDIVSIDTGTGEQLAFTFQLSLGEQDSQ